MSAIVPSAKGALDPQGAKTFLNALGVGDVAMFQLEISVEPIKRALVETKTHDVTTILNIAPFTADAIGLSQLADIITADESEFDGLTSGHDVTKRKRESLLHRLHSQTGKTSIVTLCGDGVIAICEGNILRVACLRISSVDTVGAGDAFCGDITASLDQGHDVQRSLR